MTEYMVTPINDVNAAALAHPSENRPGLNFQQIKARVAACEHENDPHAPRSDLLEFPPKIVR
jgi:hypothetical protein